MIARRFIDWRLIASLTLLAVVAYLIFAGVENARDNREKGDRIDALVVELQEQHDDAEAERLAAATERAELLRGQRDLSAKYDALLEQQRLLLRYLRRHGVDVPPRFFLTVAPASVTERQVSRPGKSPNTVRRQAQAPRVDLPGKSERGKAHKPNRPGKRR